MNLADLAQGFIDDSFIPTENKDSNLLIKENSNEKEDSESDELKLDIFLIEFFSCTKK